MITKEVCSTLEIWHKDYNLEKKDNLSEVPTEKAVFAIFGIVGEAPVNCRYVNETENLREAVKLLFENPENQGLKKFMQGSWIQMLQYELLPNSTKNERKKIAAVWTEEHQPKIDDEGEYPGYYDY